jgi:hypothetical protein
MSPATHSPASSQILSTSMTVSPHALPVTISRLSCSSKHLALPPSASSNSLSLSLSLQAPDRVRRHYKPHTLPPSTKDTKDNKKKMPAFSTTHENSLHSQLQSLAVELLSRFRLTATTTFRRALDSRGSRSKSAARVRKKKRKEEERRRSEVRGLIHSHLPCEWVDFQHIGTFWKCLADFTKSM